MVIPTHIRRSTDNASNSSNNNNSSPVRAWLTSVESWNDPNRATEATNIDAVLGHLGNSQDQAVGSAHIVDTAKAFKALADMSRSPAIRQKLTATTLPQVSSQLLQRTQGDLAKRDSDHERAEHVFLLVQVLRCICNLSADNDEARAEILRHGGVQAVAAVLQTVSEVWRQPLPVGQAAFGAALNVALDNEACAKALVDAGAVAAHLKGLSPEAAASNDAYAVWPLISMSLDNLCEGNRAATAFEGNAHFAQSILRSLARLARLISNNEGAEDSDASRAMRGAQRTLLWVMCEAMEKSPAVAAQLCQPESLLALFDILEFYLTNGVPDNDDDAQTSDSEEHGAEPSALPPNRPMPQAANRYADAVTQAIVAISGDDSALTTLFDSQSLRIRLLGILSADRGTTQDARTTRLDGMAAAAALCLGNLARTDDHCARLVAEHPALVRTLIHEWFAPRSTNVRTRHAASGLLKNLCLPAANKQALADFGLVPVAYANIDTMVVPIQANSIGILRHLLNGPPAADVLLGMFHPMTNCRGEPSVAMKDLLAVVRQTDIDAIRCEGTRLVAAAVKKIYLARQSNEQKTRDLLEQARGLLEDADNRYDVATPLVTLVVVDGRRHPLLQQESLVALTVLAATHAQNANHVRRIVELLSPANALPQQQSAAAGADADADAEAGEEEQAPPQPFSDVLQAVVRQDDGVWPQAALQAKSLLKSLGDQIANDPDNQRNFDVAGLQVLQDDLLPLLLQ
ncbi:hypothetical protein GGF40_003283 [Coemansia sp. RSA 1286]|nr:hypothetical protein GGF40_003283 [Coemansia sp. RSA 1286]